MSPAMCEYPAATASDPPFIDTTRVTNPDDSQHSAFYRLVVELATRFVNIALAEIDDAIVESLRRIGEALDIDSCVLFLPIEGQTGLRVSHCWVRPGTADLPEDLRANGNFPDMVATTRAGRISWFSSLDEVSSPIDRETFKALSTKSNASFPVQIDGALQGILAFSATRAERPWPHDDLECLRLAVAVIGQALAHKGDQQRLDQAVAEITELRDQLKGENVVLRREVRSIARRSRRWARNRTLRSRCRSTATSSGFSRSAPHVQSGRGRMTISSACGWPSP